MKKLILSITILAVVTCSFTGCARYGDSGGTQQTKPAKSGSPGMKPENKEKLGKILAYHVVSGKVMAADVKTMMAKTANGAELDIKVSGATVMVNDAKVVKADVPASNGVIHVIDKVLMPPAHVTSAK